MIERKRLLSLGYYAKAASFTGSDGDKNFKVEKVVVDEEKFLQATIWPGPFCFDKTDDSKKITKQATFDEDGLVELVDWMNATPCD